MALNIWIQRSSAFGDGPYTTFDLDLRSSLLGLTADFEGACLDRLFRSAVFWVCALCLSHQLDLLTLTSIRSSWLTFTLHSLQQQLQYRCSHHNRTTYQASTGIGKLPTRYAQARRGFCLDFPVWSLCTSRQWWRVSQTKKQA